MNIVERLTGNPLGHDDGLVAGVVVQYGGQTPLNLAKGLLDAGGPIIGTAPESIGWAEDREAFAAILKELGLRQPPNGICYDVEAAKKIANTLGYPVLVRPSYVLGGRAMEICNIEADLERYMLDAQYATDRAATVHEKNPILVDKFLKAATEVDVDCVSDFGMATGFARRADGLASDVGRGGMARCPGRARSSRVDR